MRAARVLPIIIFASAIIGFVIVLGVPQYALVYSSSFGRLLYKWGIFVIDRGHSQGPEILLTRITQVAVTAFVLLPALFVILSRRYKAGEKRWAYGAVATILAAWLKNVV